MNCPNGHRARQVKGGHHCPVCGWLENDSIELLRAAVRDVCELQIDTLNEQIAKIDELLEKYDE